MRFLLLLVICLFNYLLACANGIDEMDIRPVRMLRLIEQGTSLKQYREYKDYVIFEHEDKFLSVVKIPQKSSIMHVSAEAEENITCILLNATCIGKLKDQVAKLKAKDQSLGDGSDLSLQPQDQSVFFLKKCLEKKSLITRDKEILIFASEEMGPIACLLGHALDNSQQNRIKVFTFNSHALWSAPLAREVEKKLGLENVINFRSKLSFNRIVKNFFYDSSAYCGIPYDILPSEDIYDFLHNRRRVVSFLLREIVCALTIISYVKNMSATNNGVVSDHYYAPLFIGLSSCLLSYLIPRSNISSEKTIEIASGYARDGKDFNRLEDIGKVPYISGKRGIGGFLSR